MPSITDSSMTLVVSTGIGISVIAGILSGVCYVVAHGFKPKRYRKGVATTPATPWRCPICDCNFNLSSTSSSIFGNNFKEVYCSLCKQKVCKHRCAKYDQLQRQWICLSCHRGSLWSLQGIFSRFSKNKEQIREIPSIEDKMASDGDAREQDKENVRDFIERLVATMLGGNVDDACITRMYNDQQYVNLFERYHEDLCNALTDLGSALHISITNLPPIGQSPCNAHSNLKQIIGKLLKESLQISDLSQIPQQPEEDQERTYEELLATAILNKVVSHCQQSSNLPSSSSNASVSSRAKAKHKRRSNHQQHQRQKEYFFAKEKLDSKYDEGASSASSFNEELLHSDSSLGSTKYVDRVSLTIQQQIEAEDEEEQGSSDFDEADNLFTNEKQKEYDDLDHYRPNSSTALDDGSNWYLQKRHLFNTSSPVPVPMLVPSPTTESKVLIGDKEIDETSDLSDTASDFGGTESVPSISGIKSLIVESKTIIGGKNALGKITIDDDESSVDSGVKAGDIGESKTDISVDDDNVGEKDAEYVERYESLPRTIEVTELSKKTVEDLVCASDDSDRDEDYNSLFEGSYSRREKEKWKNPVEMKNNPYTKENIEKRASISSDGFGRDYYTRMASRPGGSYSKAKRNDGSWITSPSNDENNEEIEDYLHKAVPILIENSDSDYNAEEDTNNGFEAVTSDSDLSLVNFYDVEKSQVFRRESNEMIPIANQEIPNDQDIVVTTITPTLRDENGNFTVLHSTPKPKPRSFQRVVAENQQIEEQPRQEPKIQRAKSLFDVTVEVVENEPEADFKFMKEHPAFQHSKSMVETNQNNKNQVKRADNTLLRKIYANPIVRSFALSHREKIPVETAKKNINNEEKIEISPPQSPKYIEKSFVAKKTEEPPRIIAEETLDSRSGSDIDISELRDAGIVSNRIGLFSKSSGNLTSLSNNSEMKQEDDEERICASVKELRKKFDALSNNNNAVIHSLTARKKRVYKPVN